MGKWVGGEWVCCGWVGEWVGGGWGGWVGEWASEGVSVQECCTCTVQ